MLVLFHVVKQLLPYFVSFASIDEGLGITYAGKQDVPFYVCSTAMNAMSCDRREGFDVFELRSAQISQPYSRP